MVESAQDMEKRKIIFWTNILSPHLTWFFNYISTKFEVFVFYAEEELKERQNQGWKKQKENGYVACHYKDVNKFIIEDSGYIHVYCGFHLISFFQKECGFIKVDNFSVISEAPILMSATDLFLKYIKYFFYRAIYGWRVKNIFCMGDVGFKWFSRFFSPKKLFKFQYFVENGFVDEINPQSDTKKLIYIGQLSKRKNVSLLLEVLSFIKDTHWHLDIVGVGPEYHNLVSFLEVNDILNRVSFLNTIDNENVRRMLSGDYDCLILPSKFDGWGAVCSEALSNGVPIIVSEQCGASILVKEYGNFGFCYDGSAESLSYQLVKILSSKKLSISERRAIAEGYIEVQKQRADEFSAIIGQ
ncbi:TPA: glycosyltransferase [Vibrio vulnificus]|nr:glycosyltransferase [Vibrio vulnificus]HAS6368525.1 glycosyltransferase [Vibrio vulnificus]HDY7612327.1 glycosyltransferase [Vibrio vulnificus]